MAVIAFIMGLIGISTMMASNRLQHLRAVDSVQLIATGMCFGIAIVLASHGRKAG
ncbi:MAG TPA: hypothetical protein VHT28_14910 [Silvibacterium sp.]|jgi:hypothetical protein|nr:hypothetical protein [Silvibacterium sp.]